ncbi:MAG: type IV secretion system protein [Caulobacteraceae bacterium]
MALLCPAPDEAFGLVRGLMFTVDCNVQGLAQGAYGTLAQPGSAINTALFGLLTLYVAFIGYRMLLGRSPLRVGELTISALKIGVVVVLATNWGVYQTLIYDTLFKGPEQVASALMGVMQPNGSVFKGNPFDGLQVAFDQLLLSASSFAGKAGPQSATLQGGPGFAAFALHGSAYLMLLTTLGTVLASKIALALILGLAPLFVVFLLFAPTRGIFEGWLKAAIGFALAPLLAILSLAVQLSMLEPTLIRLAEMRADSEFDLAPPSTAMILIVVFATVLIGVGVTVAVIAAGLRLPKLSVIAPTGAEGQVPMFDAARGAAPATDAPARVAAVAAAAAAMERRDTRRLGAPALSASERRITLASERAAPAAIGNEGGVQPLGSTFRRTAGPRRSAVAARRDR